MTEPVAGDLLALATPYALHAMDPTEERTVERRLESADAVLARAFADEVRAVREVMARVSESTAQEPPDSMRARVLAALDDPAPADPGPVPTVTPMPALRRPWRAVTLAAAAVVVVGLAALGVGLALGPPAPPTPDATAAGVFAAPDVRTASERLSGGGMATVVFSRDRHAAVLVMNDVAPPAAGTVYQMWLVEPSGPHSAGVMGPGAIGASSTAVLPGLGDATALAFTVEPGRGSAAPSTPVFASLPLA